MARFQTKSRALDQLTLIPICPNSSNDGRLATTQVRSCTGNSSPMATRISITQCRGVLLVTFQKGSRVGGQRVTVCSLDLPEYTPGSFTGRHVSNRPPPNRTCTFQRIRLSSLTVSFHYSACGLPQVHRA